MTTNGTPLLQVKSLSTHLALGRETARAVDGVSFEVGRGETLGIVGESGCGKSMTALSLLRLVPAPPGRIVAGEILFEGQDLLKLSEAQMRKVRGNQIAMIFQEPMTSLNPVFAVGFQIEEAIRLHQKVSRAEAKAKAIDMLRLVGIPSPERNVEEFPHQLSGGMRQRVMIAMALSSSPKLLIADEPTTALDVTIQAQILDLISRLKRQLQMSMILISHDLGVIAETADRVAVMYAGRIVESAPSARIFARPLHPYTRGLLRALPRRSTDGSRPRLQEIPGIVPPLTQLPGGCRFCPRYPEGSATCRDDDPGLREAAPGHWVRCWSSLATC